MMSFFHRVRLRISFMSLPFISLLVLSTIAVSSSESWKRRDNFDKIQELMDAITADNCGTKTKTELRLPHNSIHQTPAFNTIIPQQQWFQNRSQMMYMHSLALNRAHFYSSILQRRNRTIMDPMLLPGFLYHYFSTAADVSSGENFITASAIFIDSNITRGNWHLDDAMPLFAPKAMRRSNNNTIEIMDYGPEYRSKPSVMETNWIPNTQFRYVYSQYDTEIYYVDIHGNRIKGGEYHYYSGPPSPPENDNDIPVNFTSPYFDCGKTNKWIVSAVAPIVNRVNRYNEEYAVWVEERILVGLVTIDMDYSRVDFNPCPASVGNEKHFLSRIARCKPTTVCEPLSGFGFRRGGYQCRCAPTYRLPSTQNGPFQGVDIEQATEGEYANGFVCIKSSYNPVDTDLLKPMEPLDRRRRSSALEIDRETENERASKTEDSQHRPRIGIRKRHAVENSTRDTSYESNWFDPVQFERVRTLLKRVASYSFENCDTKSPSDLEFPDEVGYGADTHLDRQARIALRLAHFLSAFYQNNFTGQKLDQPLNKLQLFDEVFANVIGDPDILTSGIYFDENTFVNETGSRWPRFAPYAVRPRNFNNLPQFSFMAFDMSRLEDRNYTEKPWFRTLKEKWATNTSSLQRFENKFWKAKSVREDGVEHFSHYPLYFRAPRLNDGLWTQPYYDCRLHLLNWVLTYAVPFFGLQDMGLTFMGVVTVTVPLKKLDINQCPGSSYTSNFFKNTAHCDYNTTFCVPQPRRGFSWGNYRCECRQGYELSPQNMIDGRIMEREYMNKLEGKSHRLDLLRCRPSVGIMCKYNVDILLLALVAIFIQGLCLD